MTFNLLVFAIHPDPVVNRRHSSGRPNAPRKLLANRFQIRKFDEVAIGWRSAVAPRLVLREDHVRSKGPDLIENQFLTGQRNRHHRNEARHPNNNPQPRQECTYAIGLQRLVTELERFAEQHQPPLVCFSSSMARSRGSFSGVSGLLIYRSSNAAAASKFRFCLI